MTSRNLALAETLTGTAQPAPAITLEDLWAKAEGYGYVRIYSSDDASSRDKSYHAYIYFETIPGIRLEAKSAFNLPLRTALEQAIARAEEIRGQFK